MSPEERTEAYAQLTVQVGANVQPGQLVAVESFVEHASFARAVAREAYRAGARYVDVRYIDQHVRRAMIELGPDDALAFSEPWLVQRAKELGESGAALVAIHGNPEPHLFDDLDGARVGRARQRELAREMLKLSDRLTNWTIVSYPSEGWASAVFGEPDVERLWQAVETCVRLDEPDPVAAWREHVAVLGARAAALNERRFDAIRFRGPGTDLTVGLFPETRWQAALDETVFGVQHVANMPTEEVYAAPDPARTEGVVRSTRPLQLGGSLIRDLEIRFERGEAVEVNASAGAELMRERVKADDGARRLGEVALVDGDSRVGRTGIVFLDTLFDENATCHIALGEGIRSSYDGDGDGAVNSSTIHVDFMIGGPEVEVDAVATDGTVVPLLRDDVWQL